MAGGRISELISDATNLEINSVLVDGISGRKMPGVTGAFLEIISAWVHQFLELKKELEKEPLTIKKNYSIVTAAEKWKIKKDAFFESWAFQEKKEMQAAYEGKPLAWKRGLSAFVEKESVKNVLENVLNVQDMDSFRANVGSKLNMEKETHRYYSMEMFRLLRVQTKIGRLKDRLLIASKSDEAKGEDESSSDWVEKVRTKILEFKGKLRDLKNKFRRLFGLSPSSGRGDYLVNRDMQELRKLWELKDGYIYAQNTIQIDGDILARYNLRLHRDRLVREMADHLLDFHRGNVDVGIKHWHFIVETLVRIAKAVGEKIGNPFR